MLRLLEGKCDMDKRDLHNLVVRLRLVGAYDTNIPEQDVDTCLEAARVIEQLYAELEKAKQDDRHY